MYSRPLMAATGLLAALLLAGCADESPEKRIASAKQYLQKNDTKSAVIEIKNALQKSPDMPEARYLLGATLLQDGNPVAAEVELRKALAAKHPESVVVPELARAMVMMGQAKKVVDEFGSARFGTPAADASLQTSLAAAHAMLGKPEQSQAALTAALAADPGFAPALIVTARQKAAARDFDGALSMTEGVISKDPKNADAWKLKGDILFYALNKPDDAIAAYRKSIEVNPTYGPGHFAAISVLLQQAKLDEAATQIEQLKKVAPTNPQTIYFEAQLAYQKKDYKLARDLSQQVLRLAPNSPQVLQLSGAVELQMNAPVQAEVYLAKAVQAAPQFASARKLLVVTYLRTGQAAKALATLNAGAGKDGLAPDMFTLAGEVYLQNGDAKKAEEYFAKALKLDPEDARKRTALAITHLASGQTESAVGELETIAGSDRGTTADMALISAHLRRNEFDKALAAVDKLEAKQPDKPLAANLRGRIQLAKKDNAAARKSFERALAIDPSYFAAAASLAALDMADKKPDDAKKRFEGLLAKNPKNGQALLAMAQLAAATGAGKDELAGLLNKAVEANPTEVAPRLLLIELLLNNKDTKQALAAAQSGVAALPGSPELLGALGRVQQVSGDVNQAIATYSKLVAMQPLSPLPHVRLAEAYVVNKDNKSAEQSLRKALDIKPDFLDAQRGLILLNIDAKRYAEAIKIARMVQEQRPRDAMGFATEGDIDSIQKNWEAAAAAYRSGMERSATTELAIKLHRVLIAAGKIAEPDKFAANWMRDHPKDGVFRSHLGDAALARKDYEAAEKNYLAALQIRADNAIVLNNLAWLAGQLHRDGAVAYAEKATQLAPNQPAFMDTLAMLLAEQKDYARAIELQKKAIDLQPGNASLRLNLAKIYIKAGDKANAKTELDTIAKLGEKYTGQAEVAALLRGL